MPVRQSGTISAGSLTITATVPPALRDSFVRGQWNPTAMLLEDFEEVARIAKRLPYVAGFWAHETRAGARDPRTRIRAAHV
jgi:hypothetical protein